MYKFAERSRFRARLPFAGVIALAAFAILGLPGRTHAAAVACTPLAGYTHCIRYTYSGAAQTYSVPAGVTQVKATLWGAGGGGSMPASGNSAGGAAGGFAEGVVTVTPGATLTVTSGQGGVATGTARTYGGGGAGAPGRNWNQTVNPQSNGSSGGGMSALWNGSEFVTGNALIIAGGGGGSAFWTDQPAASRPVAGPGGGTNGVSGTSTYSGLGGTQAAGGAAGLPVASCYEPATAPAGSSFGSSYPVVSAGGQFRGGDGCWPAAANGTPFEYEGGGGAGGGWFGGGGGVGQNENNPLAPTTGYAGPGGGGSGYLSALVTGGVLTAGSAPTYTVGSTAAPPQTTHALYSAGIGRGGAAATTQGAVAGNGEVVIQWVQPILRLQKALPSGRFAAADQFTLTIAGASGPATATTTGTGTTATGTATLVGSTAGTVYTLSETGASGASLSNYTTTYACTNALAGGQTPSGNGTSFTITPAAGDDLTCTFTNTRKNQADLRLTKTNTAGVNGDVDQSGDTVTSGTTTTYTVNVTNLGPDASNGAVVTDPAPTGLTCTTATCTATGGASCPAATGAALVTALQGAGVVIPTFPSGGNVSFALTCGVQ